MFNTPQKLNITLPHHWNACTAAQLEQIAAVMRDETERTTAFRPSSMLNIKTALFFLWSGLHIVAPINPRVKVEEQYFVCTHPSVHGEFNLYLWQIDYWTNGVPDHEREARLARQATDYDTQVPKKVKGLLDWLDDTSDYGLTNMPYDILCLRKEPDSSGAFSTFARPFMPRCRFRAPLPLMSDFSWQQYRIAHDLMDNYIKQMNALIRMEKHHATHSPEQMHKQQQAVDLARAMFLACVFNRKVRYIDTDTRKAVYDYHYTSNQYSDNAQYFRNFPEDRWQVILFWWSGMMRYLQRKFPHVFKVGKVKSHAPSNPLEVYTATIATLEKYLSQTEDELNRKTFILTLETLERMAKENEEMERLRHK